MVDEKLRPAGFSLYSSYTHVLGKGLSQCLIVGLVVGAIVISEVWRTNLFWYVTYARAKVMSERSVYCLRISLAIVRQ